MDSFHANENRYKRKISYGNTHLFHISLTKIFQKTKVNFIRYHYRYLQFKTVNLSLLIGTNSLFSSFEIFESSTLVFVVNVNFFERLPFAKFSKFADIFAVIFFSNSVEILRSNISNV